jgi:hypothetical protein
MPCWVAFATIKHALSIIAVRNPSSSVTGTQIAQRHERRRFTESSLLSVTTAI